MTGFVCATCGDFHAELPLCFGSPAPAAWFAIPEEEREARALLSSDQCVIDEEHFFILGQLALPIIGSSEQFVWLVWVSLSVANFERASALWHVEGRESEPPYFGWLQSALPYESSTLALATHLHTAPLGQRPRVELHAAEHPLFREQHEGITWARAQQIAEQCLHAAGI